MKSTFKSLAILLITIFCGQQVRAQLSGTIAVPSVTYPTLDSLIRTLNVQGVGTGGVIININAAQYAPVGGYQLGSVALNASTSAAKTITINGNSNTATANVGTSTTVDGIFVINGTDYVTINNLGLTDTNTVSATTQMEWGYALLKQSATAPFDGCQNITIKNCAIALKRTNTASVGIYANNHIASSTTALTITATTDALNNCTFQNNTIQNVNTAISLNGFNAATPYTIYDQNNTITGNTIQNYAGNTATAYGIYLVYQNNAVVYSNNVNNIAGSGVAGASTLYGIYHNTGTNSNVTIRNNTINLTQGSVSSAFYLINCGAGGGTSVTNIDSNSLTATANGSSATFYGVYMTGSPQTLNLNANQLNGVTSASTGSHYLFYISGSLQAAGAMNVNNNKINNYTRTATSGTTYGFYITGSTPSNTPFNWTGNKISNVSYSTTSSGSFYSLYDFSGASPYPVKTLSNDTVNTVSIGTGTFYGMYTYNMGNAPANSVMSNNLLTNVTGYGTVYGYYISSTSINGLDIYNNTASGFTGNGTSSSMYGLYVSGGTTINVYRNQINNLQTAITTSSALYGMYISSGTTVSLYNNMVSDLRTPAGSSTSPIYGMYFNGGTTINAYHNTINLNPVSTGTNFGATGIYYTNSITNFDLRNNVIRVNAIAAGTGFVAALRRSTGTANVAPSNLTTTSSGNIYWAPNATNSYLYAEGTGNPLTNAFNLTTDAAFNTPCGLYKTFMLPREGASFTENNLSQIGTTPTFAPGGSSFAKSVAVPTTAPAVTVDFNGVTRATPADAGALQFTGTALDAAAPLFTYNALPASTYCLNAPTLTATITDVSGVNTTTNAPRIYYKKLSEIDTFGTYPASNVTGFNGWKYATATNTGSTFNFTLDYTKLTAAVAPGDTIQYFIMAQDNAATPNVGASVAAFATGYCPSSVNLSNTAGPTNAAIVKNNFTILAQPALPTVSPATATACQGTGVKITANPVAVSVAATIGTGSVQNTNTTYPAPYGQWYTGARHQMLVLASELQAQGLSAGNITSMALSVATAYGSYSGFTVSMGNTALTALSTAFVQTGLTQVYYNGSYTPTAGWNTHTFTTPFYWDGVSNVIVETYFSNCGSCGTGNTCNTTSYTNNCVMNQTTTPFVSCAYYYSDGSSCQINTITTASSTASQRPNMMFSGMKKFLVNWVPFTNLYKDSLLTQPLIATDTNTVVYAAPATTATYGVANAFNGCTSATSTSHATVTVIPAPSTITTPAGTASFCGNSSLTLSGTTGANQTYQWKQAGTAISGATNLSYTTTAIGNYTLTVTNTTTGCTATSAPINVISTTPPTATATASGPTTVCGGSTVSMNANTGTGLFYQWLNNGTAITGATNTSYTAAASGNYTVAVSNAGNCATTSAAVPVTVNTINTTVSTSGPTTFCTGGNVSLSVPTAANQTYQWKQGGVAISGATNASYSATASGNYTVLVNNTATSCSATSTPAVSVTVGVGPSAVVTPSGTVGICPGNSTTLSTTGTTGISYQWQLNGNAIAGATNTSYTTSTGGNYTLIASTSPTCFTTSAQTAVVVNPAPAVNTTPSGTANVCQGSSIALTVPAGTGQTYQWKQGGVNIAGATTNTYSTNVAGNYTVSVANTLTTCAATSSNINVVVNTLPAASATASGPLTICAGDSTKLTGNTGAGLNYQWQQNGVNITGGNNANYYAFQSGSYTLVVTNTNNCSVTTAPLMVTVNPVPQSIISYTSPIVFCEGGAVVLTANSGLGLSYQWLLNNAPIYNAVSSSNIVSQTGLYTVKVTNGVGCSSTSQSVPVTVNPLPNPVITRNLDTFQTTANFNTYQWYFNGAPIAGALGTHVVVSQNGAYWVSVTDNNGCTNMSNVMFINNVGIQTVSGGNMDIKVYPNPTSQFVNIDASVKIDIMIRDLQGRTIVTEKDAHKIDLSTLANGIYMIMIFDENGQFLKTEKLFKTE